MCCNGLYFHVTYLWTFSETLPVVKSQSLSTGESQAWKKGKDKAFLYLSTSDKVFDTILWLSSQLSSFLEQHFSLSYIQNTIVPFLFVFLLPFSRYWDIPVQVVRAVIRPHLHSTMAKSANMHQAWHS